MDKHEKIQKKWIYKHLDWAQIDRLDNEVINKIVSKMETLLRNPEDILVKQNVKPIDEECLFYLIAKGKCIVKV